MKTKHRSTFSALITSVACLTLSLGLLAGCADSPKVLRIGGYEVSRDVLRYFSGNYMRDSGHTAEDYADSPELQKELEDQVFSTLREIAAYRELSDQYKLTLNNAEKAQIKKDLSDLRATYESDKDYKAALDDDYLTEDVYRELTEIGYLCDRLYDCVIGQLDSSEETVRADLATGAWYSAEYFCVSFTSDGEDSKRLEMMQDYLDRAKSGESLAKLSEEARKVYGLGEIGYDDLGIFTSYDSNVSDFLEETVRSLEVGQYSEVCSRSGLLYIARRLPISEEEVEDNFDSVIVPAYQNREFYRTVEELKSTYEIDYKSKYESLKLWELLD